MAKQKLEFGRQPPKGTKVAWGARAIFKPVQRNPMIDLLWDRQDAFGEKEEVERLIDWVRATGLPWLEETLSGYPAYTLSTSTEIWRYDNGDYAIEASPQRSAGYLYIGAWKK